MSLEMTLVGHSARVQGLAVTPDGRFVVSGDWDGTLRMWSLGTGACVRILDEHVGPVFRLMVPADGRYSIPTHRRSRGVVWDLGSGSVRLLHGHENRFSALAVTADGRRIVSGSRGQTLRVWDADAGDCVAVLTGHTEMVEAVAIAPDGQAAVSVSWDATLRVWGLG